MSKFHIIAIICISYITFINAEKGNSKTNNIIPVDTIDGFMGKSYTLDGHTLPYRLYLPEKYNINKHYPLVIVLHGAGKSQGNDNIAHLTSAPKRWASEEIQQLAEAIVLAPQCPKNDSWINLSMSNEALQYKTQILKGSTNQERKKIAYELTGNNQLYFPLDPFNLTKSMMTLISLISQIKKEYTVDNSRVYAVGGSMGGYGTFCLAYNMPDEITAIVPICGGADPINAKKIMNIPMWIFHGALDVTVPVTASRSIVKALQEIGCKELIYTEFPDIGHGQVGGRAYQLDENQDGILDVPKWLFSKQLQNK